MRRIRVRVISLAIVFALLVGLLPHAALRGVAAPEPVQAAPRPLLEASPLPPKAHSVKAGPLGWLERALSSARMQLEATNQASQLEAAALADYPRVILIPRGILVGSGNEAYDKILYYHGSATGLVREELAPPRTNWFWQWIAADPKDPNRWLLYGNGGDKDVVPPYSVERQFEEVDTATRLVVGKRAANGNILSPLWLTTNAGQSWKQVRLRAPDGATSIKIDKVEFDRSTNPYSRISFSGRVYEGSPSQGVIWQGGANEGGPNLDPATVITLQPKPQTQWLDTFSSVPAPNGDLVVSEGDSPDSGAGRLGYLANGATTLTLNGSGALYQAVLNIDLLPGTNTVIGAYEDKEDEGQAQLWQDPDYRNTTNTMQKIDTVATFDPDIVEVRPLLAGGTKGAYVGAYVALPDGPDADTAPDSYEQRLVRITDPLTKPRAAQVILTGTTANQIITAVRSDRATQTLIGALQRDHRLVHLYSEQAGGCIFPTLDVPFRPSVGYLADRVEVIAGTGMARGYGQHRVPEDWPADGAQPSRGASVNTRTGAFWTTASDLAVTTPGVELAWRRSYASDATCDLDLSAARAGHGYGWQHGYGARIVFPNDDNGEAGKVIVLSPAGNRLRFTPQAATTRGTPYTAAAGISSTLFRNVDGTYTWKTREQVTYGFTSVGKLDWVKDAHGRVARIQYNTVHGRLEKVFDESNPSRYLAIKTLSDGCIEEVADPAGRRVTFTCVDSNLATATDVLGHKVRYGYDGHAMTSIGRLYGTQQAEERLVTTSYTSNLPAGKVTQQELAGSQLVTFKYEGSLTTVTSYESQDGVVDAADKVLETEVLTFDAKDALSTIKRNTMLVQQVTYDGQWRPTRLVDGRNNPTTITYTALTAGRKETIVNPLGQTSTVTYNASELPVEIVDPAGRKTTLSYNAANYLVERVERATSSFAGFKTSYSYQGQLLRVVKQPDGLTQCVDYDQQQRVTRQSVYARDDASAPALGLTSACPASPAAKLTTTTYASTAYGWPERVTTAAGTPQAATLVYDTYRADGTVEALRQEGLANPADATSLISRETRFSYDDVGRVVGTCDPAGRWNITHYDSAGRVDWTIANAQPMTCEQAPPRDGRGQYLWQPYATTQPGANIGTAYQYDGLGRIINITEHGFLVGTMVRPAPQGTPGFSATSTRVSKMRYLTPESFTSADLAKAPQLFSKVQVIRNADQDPAISTLPDTDVVSERWYDVAGNLVREIDALSRESSYVYDALNRPMEQLRNVHDGDPRTDAPWSTLVGQTDQDLRQIMHYTLGGELDDLIVNAIAAGQTFAGTSFNPAEPDLNRKSDYQYLAPLPGAVSTIVENVATGTTPDLNRTSELVYDSATGRQTRQRDALGRWTNLEYNGFGQLDLTCSNTSYQPGSHTCPLADEYADTNVPSTTHYDELGQPLLTTNARGEAVRMERNAFGQLVATVLNYVGDGSVTTSEQNVRTRYRYDLAGRIVSQIAPPDASGVTAETTYAYDDALGVVTITDPAGLKTRMGYDGRGTLRWTECVGCIATCTSSALSSRWTAYEVDGLGRALRVVENYQDGVDDSRDDQDIITRQQYDKAGRRVETTTESSYTGDRVTRYQYDLLDRLQAVQEGAVASCTGKDCNLTTRYRYDRLGNRTQIVDALGQVRTFAYDAAAQLKQEAQVVDGVNRVKTWEYDAGGRLLWQRNARDAKFDVGYTYNGLDAVTKLTYEGTKTIDMKVDVLGRRRELTKDGATTTFVYNKLGAMTDTYAPEGHVSYQYDQRGNRTGMTYPGGTSLAYKYNNDDTLKQVLQGSTQLASYAYTPEGLPQALTRGNGATTAYCYDPLGRVLAITTRNKDGIQRSRFEYSWGRGGVVEGVEETFGTGIVPTPVPATSTAGPTQTSTRTTTPIQPSATPLMPSATATRTSTPCPDPEGCVYDYTSVGQSYTYDRVGRLTAVTGGQRSLYEYDEVGNRTLMSENGSSRELAYNEAGEVRGWTYDAAGNLLFDGSASYTYNGLGHLTSVLKGGLRTDYRYNGDGVLVGQSSGGSSTTYTQDLVSDLSQVLEVRNGTTLASTAIYGLERLATLNGAGTPTWSVADMLGSQRQTLDNSASASVLEEATFTPSGQPLQDSSTAKFGFTGELQDGATDLVNLRARWYHPATGTFLSRDPFPGWESMPYSQHPYQYAYSNPTLFKDPSGRAVPAPETGTSNPKCESKGQVWNPAAKRCTTEANDLSSGVYGTTHQCTIGSWWNAKKGACENGRELALSWGPKALGAKKMHWSAPLISLMLDSFPGTGEVKGLAEVVTGKDLVTGEDLGWMRYLGLIPLFGNDFRNGIKSTRRVAAHSDELIEMGLRHADQMADISKKLVGHTDEVTEAGSDLVKKIGCLAGANSFSADTKVATEDGGKPIGEVEVGDLVLAYDEQTNTTGAYAVTDVLVHTDPAIVYLTIDGETLETTPEHPFFVEGSGWVNAADLRFGNHVRNADGVSGIVIKVEVVQRQQVMYNLTVDTAHTFFIGEGRWLVHNIDECPLDELATRYADKGVTQEIQDAVASTIELIQEGKTPTNPLQQIDWDAVFHGNARRGENLPMVPRVRNPYSKYRVIVPETRIKGSAGPIRVIKRGDSFWVTWTHYGDDGIPSFVKILLDDN